MTRKRLLWAAGLILVLVPSALLVLHLSNRPWHQIRPGMSEPEVVAVMGSKPTSSVVPGGVPQYSMWFVDGGVVIVDYDDGRVSHCRFNPDRHPWVYRALRAVGLE